MSDSAIASEEPESLANTAGKLSNNIISKFESTLGFSESDVKNAEKLLSKTDINSQSWETLLARVADREEDPS